MKKLCFLLMLTIPFSLLAQKSIQKNALHISTGVAFGSSMSTLYGMENIDVNLGQIAKEDYPKDILPAINYRFSIHYQRILGPHFSFKIGTSIASWNLTTLSYSDEKSILNNLFLEIPLAVQYSFGEKKLRPYLELGINPMFRLAYNDYSTSASFAIHSGFGLAYQLSSVISVYGQISGRFQTIDAIDFVAFERTFYSNPSGMYVHPFEVGIELGLAFAF